MLISLIYAGFGLEDFWLLERLLLGVMNAKQTDLHVVASSTRNPTLSNRAWVWNHLRKMLLRPVSLKAIFSSIVVQEDNRPQYKTYHEKRGPQCPFLNPWLMRQDDGDWRPEDRSVFQKIRLLRTNHKVQCKIIEFLILNNDNDFIAIFIYLNVNNIIYNAHQK